MSSFLVEVAHVYQAGTLVPVDVVKACVDRHGGVQGNVPEPERGTLECPYVISNAANNKEDGMIVVRTSAKGKERGYEAGAEPKP